MRRLRKCRATCSPKRRAATTGGFTLLEIVIASSLMVVGVAALSGSILSGTKLTSSKQETAQAHNAVRALLEQMQSEDIADIYARYNANPADDPGGAGSGPGNNFQVRGSIPRPRMQTGSLDRSSFRTWTWVVETSLSARTSQTRHLVCLAT